MIHLLVILLLTISCRNMFVRVRKSVTINDTLAGMDVKDIIKLKNEVNTITAQGI